MNFDHASVDVFGDNGARIMSASPTREPAVRGVASGYVLV